MIDCPKCEGVGHYYVVDFNQYGETAKDVICEKCDGYGEVKKQEEDANE